MSAIDKLVDIQTDTNCDTMSSCQSQTDFKSYAQTYALSTKFHYGWVIDHPFDRNFYAWTLTHEPTLLDRGTYVKLCLKSDAWGVSTDYSQ